MWWEMVFWILLVPVLIILGITYGTGKKLYKLLYVLATYTYVTLATYVIDVFSLGRNWILSILVFSAILLIFVGFLMSRPSTKNKKKSKKSKTKKNLYSAIIVLIIMVVLIIIGSSSPGLTKTIKVVENIPFQSLQDLNNPKISNSKTVNVMTITYSNNGYLSVPITEQSFKGCVYSTDNSEFQEVYFTTEPSIYRNYQEVKAGDTKELKVNLQNVYLQTDAHYDKLLVVGFNNDFYYACEDLLNMEDKATIFKEIPLVE